MTKRLPVLSSTLLVLLLTTLNAPAGELTLAVANSTCQAIKKVGKLYQQEHDKVIIKYLCKSSGRLAKGLHGNAIEADFYISASRKWMDYMISGNLVSPEEVVSAWGNQLVVATPLNTNITSFSWEDLVSDKVEMILIGDPGTAPFGRHAKQALTSTNLWKQVRPKIHTKKHITLLAETLAEGSPNTVGILFVTNLTDSLSVIHSIDSSLHAPIGYYMAPLKKAEPNEEARSFMGFIQGEAAQAIFSEEGFKLTSH